MSLAIIIGTNVPSVGKQISTSTQSLEGMLLGQMTSKRMTSRVSETTARPVEQRWRGAKNERK